MILGSFGVPGLGAPGQVDLDQLVVQHDSLLGARINRSDASGSGVGGERNDDTGQLITLFFGESHQTIKYFGLGASGVHSFRGSQGFVAHKGQRHPRTLQ